MSKFAFTLRHLFLLILLVAVVSAYVKLRPVSPGLFLGRRGIRIASTRPAINDGEKSREVVYVRIDANSSLGVGIADAIKQFAPSEAAVSIAQRDFDVELLHLLNSIPNLKAVQFDTIAFAGDSDHVDLRNCKALTAVEFLSCDIVDLRISMPRRMVALSLDYSRFSDETLVSLNSSKTKTFSANFTDLRVHQLELIAPTQCAEISILGTDCMLSDLNRHLESVNRFVVSTDQIDISLQNFDVVEISMPMTKYRRRHPKSELWRVNFQ